MERITSVAPGRGFWLAHKTRYMAGKSNYGQRHSFVNTSAFGEAKFLRVTTGIFEHTPLFRRASLNRYGNCLASAAETAAAQSAIDHAQSVVDQISRRQEEHKQAADQLEERSTLLQQQKVCTFSNIKFSEQG